MRKSTPNEPGALQSSARLRMSILYLALNCRRCAFGSTSTSRTVSVCVWVIRARMATSGLLKATQERSAESPPDHWHWVLATSKKTQAPHTRHHTPPPGPFSARAYGIDFVANLVEKHT